MSSNVDKLITILDAKPNGKNKWKALCPVHNEKTPSLGITLKGDKILMHCFGCGANGSEVMDALGLSIGELFDKPLDTRTGRKAQDLRVLEMAKRKHERGEKLDHFELNRVQAAIERLA